MRNFGVRVFVVLAIISFARHASAQWSPDSISRDDRFWSRTGSYARQLALGAGGFGMLADNETLTIPTNPFSVDPLFVQENPAYAVHYPGLLAFDLGFYDGPSGGIGQSFEGYFPASQSVTLGFILARNDATTFSLVNPNLFGSLNTAPARNTYSRPLSAWELLSGFKLGAADLGIAVSYLHSDSGTSTPIAADSTTQLAEFSQLGLSAGTLMKFGDAMLDVGATMILPSLTNTTSSGTAETTSSEWKMMTLGVNSRMFIPTSTDFYLVPILNFYFANGTTTKIGSPKDLPTSTNIDAGLGVNFWARGIHIMSGVSFSRYAQTAPSIDTLRPALTKAQTILPRFTVGAEWPVLRWLTVRMGYLTSSGTETRESATSSTMIRTTTRSLTNPYMPLFTNSFNGESTQGNVSAGVGITIDRFTIDATVNSALFHGGVANFFGGYQPFGFATMSYRFD